MAELSVLRSHIVNYAKTREVYAGYRKAGYSKKYLAEHESDILLHKAAKKYFDESGIQKLPSVKSINEEYADLLAMKKAVFSMFEENIKAIEDIWIKSFLCCPLEEEPYSYYVGLYSAGLMIRSKSFSIG